MIQYFICTANSHLVLHCWDDFLKRVCSASLLASLLQNPYRMLCIMQSFCSLVLKLQLLFSCIGYSHDSHLFYIFVSIKFHFSIRFFKYHFLHFYFSLVLYATYLLFYALMIHTYSMNSMNLSVLKECLHCNLTLYSNTWFLTYLCGLYTQYIYVSDMFWFYVSLYKRGRKGRGKELKDSI